MIFSSAKKSFYTNEQQAQDAEKMLLTVTPLVQRIYRNKAMFAINKGLYSLVEFFFYLLGASCIVFSLILSKVFPFYIMDEFSRPHVYEEAGIGKGEIETFTISIRILVVLIGLLLIYIGTMLRSRGKRKSLLQEAAKELKHVENYLNGVKDAKLNEEENDPIQIT